MKLTKAEKREYYRDYKWRKTQQGEFESSFLSLDAIQAGLNDPDDCAMFSDAGAGAERIRGYEHGTGGRATFRSQLEAARRKIRRNAPECLEVFDLIVKNGSNREESIWEMVKGKAKHGNKGKRNISVKGQG